MKPKRQLVEPGALSLGTLASREGFVDRGERELSIAISLKRIADALDDIVRTGAAINVDARLNG